MHSPVGENLWVTLKSTKLYWNTFCVQILCTYSPVGTILWVTLESTDLNWNTFCVQLNVESCRQESVGNFLLN